MRCRRPGSIVVKHNPIVEESTGQRTLRSKRANPPAHPIWMGRTTTSELCGGLRSRRRELGRHCYGERSQRNSDCDALWTDIDMAQCNYGGS
jgi:hypothetical protein